jgi:hypothetical protein
VTTAVHVFVSSKVLPSVIRVPLKRGPTLLPTIPPPPPSRLISLHGGSAPSPLAHPYNFLFEPNSPTVSLRVVVLVAIRHYHAEPYPKNDRDDGEDDDHDEEAPPLELPRPTRRLDACFQLLVGVLGVIVHLICLLFDLLYLGFLVDDYLVQLLEEQCQLAQCSLDALDVIVTRAHGAEYTRRLPTSVRLKLCNV